MRKSVILDIQQDLNDMVEEHKNVFENEPVLLTPPAIREAMAEKVFPRKSFPRWRKFVRKPSAIPLPLRKI